MDNFDNKVFQTQRVNAPEGMYEQVRQRIIRERISIAKTRRQLAIGSALLLIVGGLNIGLIIFENNTPKRPDIKENTEQMLYKTYFDNAINLSDEK
jgi:hypothetical protein